MQPRPGFKVLGLCALAMGIVVIGTAGVARAEIGACWGYINASSELRCFESPLEPNVSIAVENSTGTLLIENVNFEILCKTAAVVTAGGALSSNGTILLFKVLFSGCIGLKRTPSLEKLAACTPEDPTDGKGFIVTKALFGLIVLHSSQPVVLVFPEAGEILTEVQLPEECAVGTAIIIKGQLVLQDAGGQAAFEKHELSHLIQEFTSLQLMKVGVNKATLDGAGVVTLASPDNALKWAGKAR